MTIINTILKRLGLDSESRAQSKQPLSAEIAYSLSSIGKSCTKEALYCSYFNTISRELKNATRYHYTNLLIHYPEWLCKEHKDTLVKTLKELEYEILFNNEDMLLVSWKIK